MLYFRRHFVESAFITGRLTVALSPPNLAALEAGLGVETSPDTDGLIGDSFMSNVLIKAGNTVRVDSCTLQPSSSCESVTAPLVGMPASVCKQLLDLTQPVVAPGCCEGWRSLERRIAAYNCKQPVTGFKCSQLFCVRSLSQFLFTNHFFHHLERRRAEVHAVRK